MRCFIFLLALPFALMADHPASPHYLEHCLQVDNAWVLVLNDASCWELAPMKPNEQSWSEWWQGKTPEQPEERFLVDLTTWSRGGQIQVNKTDFSPMGGYPYLLHHLNSGQLVYARLLPSDAIWVPKVQIAQTFQQKGTSKFAAVRYQLKLEGEHFLLLDDDTSWKLHPARENTRSIGQWWSGVQLEQPDPAFLFSPSNWQSSTPLILSFYNWRALGFDGAYDEGPIRGSSCLIENSETKEMVYASPVAMQELVSKLLKHADTCYAVGHASGYTAGYLAGKESSRSPVHVVTYPPPASMTVPDDGEP